ncbi:MAG TPA: response regulator, partial [Blastocatellia bacterium]
EAYSDGPSHGARFTVRLPLVVARSKEDFSTDNSKSATGPDNGVSRLDPAILHGLRILAVDDDPDTRATIKGVLEQYGADVITASSAAQAFEALLGLKPDLLVCDIGMPEEDGYSLIRKVRALKPEQGGNTPAIALTGYVRIEERMRALEAGYQMFVPKPVEADELASIMASLAGPASKNAGA